MKRVVRARIGDSPIKKSFGFVEKAETTKGLIFRILHDGWLHNAAGLWSLGLI